MEQSPRPDLIAGLRSADPQTLAALYERYGPAIYRYIYFRVGDAELAKDLQSDVFLRMVEGARRYEDRGHPISSWLYRIARDRTIDALRRKERTLVRPLTDCDPPCDGPEVDVGRSFASAAVRRALAQLPDHQRQVLMLRFVYDLSLQEAANQMGRSVGALKALQHRALQALGQILRAELGPDGLAE